MSSHWGYCHHSTHPESWSDHFPEAAGVRQSPVDIRSTDSKNLSGSKKLQWKYTPEKIVDVKNTGHAWQVDVQSGGSSLSGGPLESTYELAQLHSHWGENDSDGSEHSIDGKKFAGELHFVHWNSQKYGSVADAAKYPDGFCVLGVLLKAGAKNEELQKIVDELSKVEYKNQKTKLKKPLDPTNLLPKNGSFYTYLGSLTTPPCSECVIWVVFKDPIEVSQEQLEAFRKLKFHTEEEICPCNHCEGMIKKNYRPTLSIGEREILEGR